MASKLSVHNLRPNASSRKMVEAGCRVAKLVGDLGAGSQYKLINPNITVIGRFKSHHDNGEEITAENMREKEWSPVDAARYFIDRQFEQYRLNPSIIFWEGCNEPVWKNTDEMLWYGLFESERIKILNSIGLKAVIGNFSTGVPHIQVNDLSWWRAFLPALQTAKTYGAILGLHEYSTDKFSHDWDGKYGWNTFRYRRVHDWFLVPNQLGDLKIVLTEFGIDYKIRDLNYLDELIWADSIMRQDDYLLGATIFTFGSDNSAWDNFNVDGANFVDQLCDHVRSLRNTPNPIPPPQPVPTPTPIPVPPPSTKFKANDVVKVTADIGLRVRSTPKLENNIRGVQLLGSLGKIIGGPVRSDDINWWLLDYDNGSDGWSSEVFLEKFVVSVPPIDPTPIPSHEELVFEEDFSHGHYLPFGPQKNNVRIPVGWLYWTADFTTPRIEGQDESQWFIEAETEIKTKDNVHISETDLYFKISSDPIRYAIHLLQLFHGWGRLWLKLWRKFNLSQGKYRLEVEYFPDILLDQKNINNVIVKTPDRNPLNNEFRFIHDRNEFEFSLGDKHPSAQFTTMRYEFDHPGGEIELGGEFRNRWGVLVAGYWIRFIRIYKIG